MNNAHKAAFALLIAGAVLIAAGAARGDSEALRGRASFICMECAGIG